MAKHSKTSRFPSREEILEYIEATPGKVTKREIARAFHIKGQDRARLKAVLRELLTEGTLAKEPGKSLRPGGRLPTVLVVEISGTDEYGDLMAVPQGWERKEKPPRIYIAYQRRKKGVALAKGDRALVRLILEKDEDGDYYAARLIRVLKGAPRTFIGVYHTRAEGGEVTPADKKMRTIFNVPSGRENGAADNALVLAEPLGRAGGRAARYLKPDARVLENLGDLAQPKSISLIAIHHHDIPFRFPNAVLAEAKAVQPPSLKGRTDLQALPLITIDPEDARDHDDAILAAPDADPGNKGGFVLTVAIADVAHFVPPGSALDKEARFRGNSCYFPDRVVPMLPDNLSGNLCSLVRGQTRAAMVAEIKISAEGRKLTHRFYRALIRCAANLSYREAQESLDAKRGGFYPTLKPLHDAYLALKRERDKRGPLELDLPERKVHLNPDGSVREITIRETLPAHKIVEEFMIAANVAAAETLIHHRVLCMFRVHEEPDREKLSTLRDYLETINLKFPKGQVVKPPLFNHILRKVENSPLKYPVNDMVLRTQSQACYSPDNLGHFGLALNRYAHFTSPIRRYSDILVHRGLITALKLGRDGLDSESLEEFRKTGEDISNTERRAMAAERESTDRYLAQYHSDKVGETFRARISGVTRFGLFASVHPSGADGFIPMTSLNSDYFDFDPKRQRLVGRRTRKIYRLGDQVETRLVEADKFTGGLRFAIRGEEGAGQAAPRAGRRRARAR